MLFFRSFKATKITSRGKLCKRMSKDPFTVVLFMISDERKVTMKNIVPNFWFDKEAEEAVDFYLSLFEHSRVTSKQVLEGTPSGTTTVINFELDNQPFTAFNAGPLFEFNSSISLMVLCSTKKEVTALWQSLVQGGEILMKLDAYPFSDYYGWLQDRYGLNWQIIYTEAPIAQKIIPHLLFSNGQAGQAEDAIKYYTELFPQSAVNVLQYYESGSSENTKAKVMFSQFELAGMQFIAMDNPMKEDFTFNEAISLMVVCENQDEIDYYWEKLSVVPEAEQCGWLKDAYGVSWQIVHENMDGLLSSGSQRQINNVTQAFLNMKKLDSKELQRVWQEAE